MATIPLWATGRNLTTVLLTLQNVNPTTGVLSDSAVTANVQAVVNEIGIEDNVATEEISAITSTAEHHVGLMQGARVRVEEILTQQASVLPATGPRLPIFRAALVAGSTIAKVQWQHGGTPWTYYGTFNGFSGPFRGKGRQTASISFLPVDIGSPNPINA